MSRTPSLAYLSAVLIAPDGKTKVTLFNVGSLTGANLTGTTFSDAGTTSITSGTAPYTGTFKVTDPKALAQLIGQSVNGTWTLQLTNTATGVTGTLKSWSLTITPQAVASALSVGDSRRLGVNTDLDVAGYRPRRLAATGKPHRTAQSQRPNLADLSAVLVSPDGSTQVTLLGVGDLSGTSMVNTVFSPSSAYPLITTGSAPYTGVFYVAGLSQFQNMSLLGTWKLVITNAAAANAGTLVSWSLGMTPQLAIPPQPAQAEGRSSSATPPAAADCGMPSPLPHRTSRSGSTTARRWDRPLTSHSRETSTAMARPTWQPTSPTAVWTISESTRDGASFTFGTPASSTYSGSIPLVGNFSGPAHPRSASSTSSPPGQVPRSVSGPSRA